MSVARVMAEADPSKWAGSVNCAGHHLKTGQPSSFSGVLFRRETPDVHHFPVYLHPGQPLATPLVKGHAAICRRRVDAASPILTIPLARHYSQVRPSIVERIAVDMIALQAISALQAQQFTMENHGAGSSISIAVAVQKPAPLIGPGSVSRINQRISSNRPVHSAEWYTSSTVLQQLHVSGETPLGATTLARAKLRIAPIDLGTTGKKVLTALTAGTGDGTLMGHLTLHRSGVTPPAGCTARGYFVLGFYHA